MACNVCHGLLLSQELWDPMPRFLFREGSVNRIRLLESAEAGCHTCRLIRDTLCCFMLEKSLSNVSSILLCTKAVRESQLIRQPHLSVDREGDTSLGIYLFAQRPVRSPDHGVDPCPWPLPVEPPSSVSNSEVAVNRARQWLQQCLDSHEKCSPGSEYGAATKTPLPSRVLDVSPPDCHLRLHETQNEHASYICLSHCWGNSQQLTTTHSTLQSRKDNIAFHTLPRTFQDAVTVVRKLGVRYLWIDSLCIIQDDKDDWQKEAALMCDVYQNSFLTIAATAARGSSDGLFASIPCHSVSGTTEKDKPFTIRVREAIHHRRSYQLPLLSRAWVYQERLISRRVLHFGGLELFWECMETSCCECGEMDLEEKPPKKSMQYRKPVYSTDKERCRIWHEMVEEYTDLSLSFVSDREVAFRGLAKEMQPTRQGRYLAGLWEDSLLEDLAWKCLQQPKKPRPAKSIAFAPTWSWTSVDGHCRYLYSDIGRSCELVQIASPDPASLASNPRALGCITLRGNLLTASARHIRSGDTTQRTAIIVAGSVELGRFTADYPLWEVGEGFIPATEIIYCFGLGSNINHDIDLVLRCVSESLQLYERIGIATRNRYLGDPYLPYDLRMRSVINLV